MNDLKTQITTEIETADRLTPIPIHGKEFEPPRSHRLYRSFEVLQEERADEWVNRAYELYCEQWIKQGRRKTSDFVSAVWCNALYFFVNDDILRFLRLAFGVDDRTRRLTDPMYSRIPQGMDAVRRLQSVARIYSQVLKLWQETKIPAELAALETVASLPNAVSSSVATKADVQATPSTAYDRTKENALKVRLNRDGTDQSARHGLVEELKRQQRLAIQLVELQGPQFAMRVFGRTDLEIAAEIKALKVNSVISAGSAAPENPTVVEPKPDLKTPVFTHSETYESITFNGEEYTLQERQAAVVKLLHEAVLKGHPAVPRRRILAVADCQGMPVRDIFKSRLELWGTLIINCEDRQEGRGFYRLHDSIQA